jgi:DNA polymerase-3 subunit delta'
VGKFLASLTLAKALNCMQTLFDSCDICPACLKIEKNQHPDVHIIDPTLERISGSYTDERTPTDTTEPSEQPFISTEPDSRVIKIEAIRSLQQQIYLRPYEARHKVFIINDAHRFTPEAANALLKTLEEPSKDSTIILVTARPEYLFKTVVSRCQVIKFYPLPIPTLEEILRTDYHLDQAAAHFLAYFCEGRIGKALRLKEQDILGEKNRVIDEFILHKERRLADKLKIDKHQMQRYLNILSTWFRDVYTLKADLSSAQLIHADRADELYEAAQTYSFTSLDNIFIFLASSLLYLEQNINPKLLLANLEWSFPPDSVRN